jgi:hypothetical protein
MRRGIVGTKVLALYIGSYYVTAFLMQAANDCDLEPVAYEFFTQAFILYEEEIAV